MKGKKNTDRAIFYILFVILAIIEIIFFLLAVPVARKNSIILLFMVLIVLLILFFSIIGTITDIYDLLSTVTINEYGIDFSNKYHKEVLSWDEVKDYGIFDFQYMGIIHYRYIYFSGHKILRKSKKDPFELAKILGIRMYRYAKRGYPMFLPSYIRKKRNQKKEDIIICFRYTDEWMKYISSLEFFKEKQAAREEVLEQYRIKSQETKEG